MLEGLISSDKTSNTITLIDVAIPDDRRIVVKKNGKTDKYQDLWIELKWIWK